MKGESRRVVAEKVKSGSRSKMKLWMIRATTSVVLWTCVVQLTTLGEMWGPRVLKGWPSCFLQDSAAVLEDKVPILAAPVLPPKRVYKNNGYLMVSCNGGLNQMRAAICDMVAIARYLNVTLIVPELDKTSFWADPSEFQDIFDVDHFITSLRDEVRILKELPPRLKRRMELGVIRTMPPVSWSDISYYRNQVCLFTVCLFIQFCMGNGCHVLETFAVLIYHSQLIFPFTCLNDIDDSVEDHRLHKFQSFFLWCLCYSFPLCKIPLKSVGTVPFCCTQVLPLIQKYKVVHLNRTDTRLANNGQPLELQKLRCRVNFSALRFTLQIEELGKRVVKLLRQNGPFLVLHLRYEMDMLAFSGCTQGCNHEEVEELTRMRYAYPWWKEKIINSDLKRKDGLCPLTPEETTLTLRALDIDPDIQIYIAAGEIYGGERRMATLASAYPKLVRKEVLLEPSDLRFFENHSSQMAALDYIVSLESDIFVPTYDGNMAKVVEGHRRFLGFKKTILLERRFLVDLIDCYNMGSLSWDEFSSAVKEAHADHMGTPRKRLVIPDRPKEEDYFYSNPEECLEPSHDLLSST
ncbi:hypothetical protein HS088_TW16G00547 [Tripterygium wilfordii]|uniref:O-fucosyltransferase family protein n=1 Tax=Tripterygium wilfordii TaxID=458696 RepID=A0A7J7CJ63_TRIWF|nr:hypothetical protein HS088_TW16G00547 [Tripterygium wilfordii]